MPTAAEDQIEKTDAGAAAFLETYEALERCGPETRRSRGRLSRDLRQHYGLRPMVTRP